MNLFFFYIFGGRTIDKYYTSVHPLSNTNLIYIYMLILVYANCVVMYCVSFYVVVGNKLYLILSYLILSYLILSYLILSYLILSYKSGVSWVAVAHRSPLSPT